MADTLLSVLVASLVAIGGFYLWGKRCEVVLKNREIERLKKALEQSEIALGNANSLIDEAREAARATERRFSQNTI